MNQIEFRTIARLPTKSKDLEGTALATLSALMKAIRMNDAKPLTFLLRERLKERSERRQLNILLNAIALGLEKAKNDRLKPTKKNVGAIGSHVTKVRPGKESSGGVSPKDTTVSVKEAVESPTPPPVKEAVHPEKSATDISSKRLAALMYSPK
jgi:hypothetical protein